MLVSALVWLFGPGLIWSHIPAFRDAYHFYYPQAVWLDRCAEQGNLFPVWNPDEGLGVSLAGQPTAALYYPLRIVWLLPGLSVAQRFSLLVIVHLLIAAAGMRYAAAQLKLSVTAGWLAAISFSLSCPVFFQHNNPIYLCSAAWIGFASGALCGFLRHPKQFMPTSLIFALACSLMLLAGDPHTAINSFIIGGIWLSLAKIVAGDSQEKIGEWQFRSAVSRSVAAGLWLVCAGLIFTALTAVQWIPAWRYAQHSSRAGQAMTQTGESRDALVLPHVEELLRNSRPPRHRIYDFSLSPWHLATALWPTLGGDYLPNNSRLFAALPAEGRMWIPSLYFGCLPCLLVLTALVRKRTWTTNVLMVVAALALLAALGSYSAVWLLRQSLNGLGLQAWTNGWPPDSVGGVYWLLTATLPAYGMFRYPAKWTVWLVATASLLAAHQLNLGGAQASPPLSKRLTGMVQILSGAGLIAALAIWIWAINSTWPDRWLASAAPDIWLGPPDARAVAQALIVAFAVPLGVVTLKINTAAYALITLAEMTLCASCWVSFLPPPAMDDQFAFANPDESLDQTFVWADRSEGHLLRDQAIASRAQFAQAQADYQQTFLLGKLADLTGARCLSATQSIESSQLATIRTWLSRHDQLSAVQPELDQVLRELGVNLRLVRQRSSGSAAQFAWQPIANARPMCEPLPSGDAATDRHSAVSWQWLDSNRLEVHIPASLVGQLLIRQFNDGGWSARDAHGQELTIASEQLFVMVPLAGNEGHVRLTRKWLR